MGLRAMSELAIMHNDACSISSLKVRRHFRHFMSYDFPMKGPLWKTLTKKLSFCSLFLGRVLLKQRECSSRTAPLGETRV